jgi:hypothetical protein
MARLDSLTDKVMVLQGGSMAKVMPKVLVADGMEAAGGIAGLWSVLKPLYIASSADLPVGIKVFDADNKVYQLTGTTGLNAPSGDAANWTLLNLGGAAGATVAAATETAAGIAILNGSATPDATDNTQALTAAGLVALMNNADGNDVILGVQAIVTAMMGASIELTV